MMLYCTLSQCHFLTFCLIKKNKQCKYLHSHIRLISWLVGRLGFWFGLDSGLVSAFSLGLVDKLVGFGQFEIFWVVCLI